MIFVVGNSRSGTTMLARVLGRNARVFTFEELHFFGQVWEPADAGELLTCADATAVAARVMTNQRDGILSGNDPRRYTDEAAVVVGALGERRTAPAIFEAVLQYETTRHGKEVPLDQTPRNVFYLPEILSLYPTSRVVIMVRDPRDVLSSQKRKWKMRFLGHNRDPLREALRVKMNYHPVTTSLLWNAAVKAGERVAGHERVRTVRFEDVLQEPAEEIGRICAFLDIAFDETMLAIPHVNSSFEKPDWDQRGINKSAIGRWQRGGLSATEMYLCERISADVMRRHGYRTTAPRPGLLSLILSLATLPVKAAVALLLNASRMRSLGKSFRRRFASQSPT